MIVACAIDNGFGDRLLGITSCYILSKILDTEFRIYCVHPFSFSDIFVENKVMWNTQDYIHPNKEMQTVVYEDSGEEWFNHLKEKHNRDGILYITCIYPYYLYLFNNQKIELFKEIGNIENVISYVFNTLFKIPKHLTKKLINGNNTIGVQIRTLKAIAYDIPKISDESIKQFIIEALNLCKNSNINNIYVSTDFQHIIDCIPQYYIIEDNDGNQKQVNIITSKGKSKHIYYDTFNDTNDKIKIIVDMINLSRCEELIISHWSNYGRISALLSGNEPYVIPMNIEQSHKQTVEWYNEITNKGLTPDQSFGINFESGMTIQKCKLNKLLTKTSV